MKDDDYLNAIDDSESWAADVPSHRVDSDSDSDSDSEDSVMDAAFSSHTPPILTDEATVIDSLDSPELQEESERDAPADIEAPAEKTDLDHVEIAPLESAVASNGGSVAIPQSVLGSISVDVRVELGETLINLNQLYELREGQILELDRELGAPLDVVVNGQTIAKCEIVSINYRYAIRIIELINTP